MKGLQYVVKKSPDARDNLQVPGIQGLVHELKKGKSDMV